MPIRACQWCSAPIYPATTGRPARFCGPTCRQAARRADLLANPLPPPLATPRPRRRLATTRPPPLTPTPEPHTTARRQPAKRPTPRDTPRPRAPAHPRSSDP